MENIQCYLTNFSKNIFNELISIEVYRVSANNFITIGGTIIHVFEILPYMTRNKNNNSWFNQDLLHFKKC